MKNENLSIEKRGDQSVAPPTPAQLLSAMVEKGVTAENVAAFKDLAELQWKFEERQEKKEFEAAFVALQAEMKAVKAVKPVPNRDGSVRYKFAPYEEIMAQVSPLLEKHGFTISFSTDYREGRMIKTCKLTHGSHTRENSFAVRIGQGPPGATETQADGAAATYAKRGALCDALNIVIDHDDDARMEGGSISEEQAEELQRRVIEVEGDAWRFLEFCGVKVHKGVTPTLADYKQIAASKYDAADEMLRKKESRGR